MSVTLRQYHEGGKETRQLTIHIAEATGFTLLCVMQPTGPVDSNVTFSAVQARCAFHGAASADATELEQTIKDRTVISDVVFALLPGEVVHVVGSYFVQEVDVFVRMELRHLVLRGWFRTLLQVSIL